MNFWMAAHLIQSDSNFYPLLHLSDYRRGISFFSRPLLLWLVFHLLASMTLNTSKNGINSDQSEWVMLWNYPKTSSKM